MFMYSIIHMYPVLLVLTLCIYVVVCQLTYPTISFTLFVSLSLSLLVIMRPEEMITDIDLHDNVLYSNHYSTNLNSLFLLSL